MGTDSTYSSFVPISISDVQATAMVIKFPLVSAQVEKAQI